MPSLGSCPYYNTVSTVDQSDSVLFTGAIAEVPRKSLYSQIMSSHNDSIESEQTVLIKKGRVKLPPIQQEKLPGKGAHKNLFKSNNESKPFKVPVSRKSSQKMLPVQSLVADIETDY